MYGNQGAPALVLVLAKGSLKLDDGLLSERKGAISILFDYNTDRNDAEYLLFRELPILLTSYFFFSIISKKNFNTKVIHEGQKPEKPDARAIFFSS